MKIHGARYKSFHEEALRTVLGDQLLFVGLGGFRSVSRNEMNLCISVITPKRSTVNS